MPDGEENQEDTDQAQGRRRLPLYFATFQRFQKKKKNTHTHTHKNPWVRLTWKKVLWGRSDETRRLALVLAHGVTFGKLLPLSLSYLSCTMGRHGKPHLTSVERSYEFEFLQYWLPEQAPPCLLLSHPRLPFPLRL